MRAGDIAHWHLPATFSVSVKVYAPEYILLFVWFVFLPFSHFALLLIFLSRDDLGNIFS